MSKPPTQPTRSPSPSLSLFTTGSTDSDTESLVKSLITETTSSKEIRRLYDAFESAVPFSQLIEEGGRGELAVQQTQGILHHIWASRDASNPALCFDKHDRRPGTIIYSPPKRGPGGVVMPCCLIGAEMIGNGAVQSVNIVNNNVALQSVQERVNGRLDVNGVGRAGTRKGRTRVQATFKSGERNANMKLKGTQDNRGRFKRKHMTSIQDVRVTAPSIPLNTKGLRRLLKQWVMGDEERGLLKPLAQFSVADRNGKDPTGKSNKTLYSKRRTVALATLLALQDAFENHKSFSQAIGLSLSQTEIENRPLSWWEKVSQSFLKREARNMSHNDIIELGAKMYCPDVLKLLPHGNA